MGEQAPPRMAAIIDGQRYVIVRQTTTGEPAFIDMSLSEPDVRNAIFDGRLDAEDLARVLTGFRVPPMTPTPSMHCMQASDDRASRPYVFDEESGMVYILE